MIVLLAAALASIGPQGTSGSPLDARRTAETFLATLGAAWESGDASRVLSHFVADRPSARAQARREALQVFGGGAGVDCDATLVRAEAEGDSLGLFARVRFTTAPARSAPSAFQREEWRDDFFLLRRTPEGWRARRRLDYDPCLLPPQRPGREVGCDACNWRFARPAGWHVVPRPASRFGATEAVTLLPPDGDATLDFFVFESPEPCDPAAVARTDLERFARDLGLLKDWTPPECRKGERTDAALPTARTEFPFRLAAEEGGGAARALRCYLAYGCTLYAFVLHGEEEALERCREAFAETEASFRLVDARRTRGEQRRAMLAAHRPGGAVEGRRYRNPLAGVAFEGPEGWCLEEIPGPALFRVHGRPTDLPGTIPCLDVYGAELPSGWDESAVEREMRSREEERRARGVRGMRVLASRRLPHEGVRAVAFVRDSLWEDPVEGAVRERFALVPFGALAVGLAARCAEGTFEETASLFDQVLASLGRD